MDYLDLKLGYACNNACAHCVVAGQREAALRRRGSGDRGTAECRRELLDSLARGIKAVTFTGGEPTIRPDFLGLLEFAAGRGLFVTVQSNGRMFAYPPFAAAAARLAGRFVIALHGPNAAVHDRVTGVPGSFLQTALGIRNLVKAGAFVLGKAVITRANYRHLPGLVRRLAGLGAGGANVAFPHASGGAWENFEAVVPRYREVLPHVRAAIRAAAGARPGGFPLEFEAIPPCLLRGAESYCADLPRRPACRSELKQLDVTIRDWQRARAGSKAKGPACRRCRYGGACEGVWREYPARYGFSELKPVL